MTMIKKLAVFSLVVLSTTIVVSMEKKIELPEQKTELPKKLENFDKLPKDLKVEILKKHLEKYVKDPETLNQAIAELRTLSKEIKTIIDTDPLLKKHIEELRDKARGKALLDWVNGYKWNVTGQTDKDVLEIFKKLKNYETLIKANESLRDQLKMILENTTLKYMIEATKSQLIQPLIKNKVKEALKFIVALFDM